jgi:DNA-binding MarR family transcriptional regulator
VKQQDSRRNAVNSTFRTLRLVIFKLEACMKVVLSGKNLSLSHIMLLRYILVKGEATPMELARELNVTTGNITGLLDKLENEGLVVRNRSAKDRRVINITVTQKTREQFRNTSDAVVNELMKPFQGFSLEEIMQLNSLLNRLNEKIEER